MDEIKIPKVTKSAIKKGIFRWREDLPSGECMYCDKIRRMSEGEVYYCLHESQWNGTVKEYGIGELE